MFTRILRTFSEQCIVLHPIFRINRGKKGELAMAEEAVGLAKSLGWSIQPGPNFLEKASNDVDAIDSSFYLPGPGRKLGSSKHTVDGEPLKNGDKVYAYGSGLHGYYFNGKMHLDLENYSDETDTDQEELNEWSDPALRQNLAASGLIRIRKQGAPGFFGTGKILELSNYITLQKITSIFINTTLTPVQQRNLESQINEYSGRKVTIVDRFGIILRIFSERAKSKVSKLQLELAYLKYIKTRLVRGENNTILSLMSLFQGCYKTDALKEMEIVSAKGRGSSGSGKMSGEGETQLELERRLITDREGKLRGELKELQSLQVKRQKDSSIKNNPTIAIIGYTNAGKTALMNHYTGANLVSENLLFQTLSTTARKLMLPSGTHGILLDTVGFISDLPHELIEAFKSTLEGVLNADILLHIRDISHPYSEVQKKIVFQVLKELNYSVEEILKKYIEVWNKIDLVNDEFNLSEIENSPYPIVPISAKHGINCDKLIDTIDALSLKVLGKQLVKIRFPLSQYNDRMQWIIDQLKIRPPEYQVDPYNNVHFEVYMDDGMLQRYISAFEGKKRKLR